VSPKPPSALSDDLAGKAYLTLFSLFPLDYAFCGQGHA